MPTTPKLKCGHCKQIFDSAADLTTHWEQTGVLPPKKIEGEVMATAEDTFTGPCAECSAVIELTDAYADIGDRKVCFTCADTKFCKKCGRKAKHLRRTMQGVNYCDTCWTMFTRCGM